MVFRRRYFGSGQRNDQTGNRLCSRRRFPAGELPDIYDAVRVDNEGQSVVLEVMQHLGNDAVRCIALSSTDGLARGMAADSTGSPLTVPVGKETLGRMFNVTGDAIDGGPALVDAKRQPIHRPAPGF